MMTEFSVFTADLLQSAHETVDGVDSGVSSCSESEPSSPVLSQHFTPLTNALFSGYTESADWPQNPYSLYSGTEDPHSTLLLSTTGDDHPWDTPTSTLSTANGEWLETRAGFQVCHTGNGNAQVKLGGGLTYDINVNIDIPVVKTEMTQDTTSRTCQSNKYSYLDDINNNNINDSTMYQAYHDNYKSCFVSRNNGYEMNHSVPFQYRDAREGSPDERLPARKRQSVTRTERLWEFILRLLGDPKHNPDLIEWVERDDGTFRLNNSKAIAHKWGMRKNNGQMTYEKLSRALRYYYHRQILEPVLGKKLVYRFGPNATQVWKNRVYRPQSSR